MATGASTTAKTDNIDGTIKEAYKKPKPAGIIHCPFCTGSGSIHTHVCEHCDGDGHIMSLSVKETDEKQIDVEKEKLEEKPEEVVEPVRV